jgi:hypothetical protein
MISCIGMGVVKANKKYRNFLYSDNWRVLYSGGLVVNIGLVWASTMGHYRNDSYIIAMRFGLLCRVYINLTFMITR